MRIYGIAKQKLNFRKDSELSPMDELLRGRPLEEQVEELDLYLVTDKHDNQYIGIVPLFPWENARAHELDTLGKAKRFIARRLMRIVTNELDDIKSNISMMDVSL